MSAEPVTAVTYADFKINLSICLRINKVKLFLDVDVKNFTSFEDPIIKFVFSERMLIKL